MDNSLVGGNIDAAVLLGSRQTEGVVILVDGAADGAQRVVAVGHGIGDGELLQAGGLCGLDDTHKGNIMGDQSVELDLHLLGILALVVGTQDGVGDGFLAGFVGSSNVLSLIGVNDLTVYQISAFFDDFYHRMILLKLSVKRTASLGSFRHFKFGYFLSMITQITVKK